MDCAFREQKEGQWAEEEVGEVAPEAEGGSGSLEAEQGRRSCLPWGREAGRAGEG